MRHIKPFYKYSWVYHTPKKNVCSLYNLAIFILIHSGISLKKWLKIVPAVVWIICGLSEGEVNECNYNVQSELRIVYYADEESFVKCVLNDVVMIKYRIRTKMEIFLAKISMLMTRRDECLKDCHQFATS
jgi:hypothetical protein